MDLNAKIFDFYYDLAFRDATMRKAFKRKDEEKYDDAKFHERKSKIKDAAKGCVANYIDLIMKGKCGEDTTRDTIIGVFKETSQYGFTFGNAQKLVNMTAKYFYMICYNDKSLRKNFKYCHCPMDSRMINVVLDRRGNEDKRSIKSNMGWSMLGLNDENDENGVSIAYQKFQQIIKEIGDNEQIYPLEVDYKYW